MTSRLRDAAYTTVLVVRESFRSFSRNRDFEAAATLAYYGFLSLMPLLLLVIYLLGLFLQSAESMRAMADLVTDLFPTFNKAILVDLQKLASARTWGLLSIVVLIWSMTPFAGALRSTMRRLFKSDQILPFLKGKVMDVGAILMILVLFITTVAWRVFMTARQAEGIREPALLHTLGAVFAFGVTILVVGLFFAAFAPLRLRLWQLLTGAATTTVLLTVIRPVFGLMLQFNPNYGYAFGSLKAIFLLIVWVFYLFAVMLFGAEVMANAHRKEALLLRGFFTGMPSADRVAQRLLSRFIRTLKKDEVLFREGDPGREMFYVVAGAVALSVGERVLFTAKEGAYFGEMSMLMGAPRSATATAADATQLVAISEDNFDTILRENPSIVRSILKELATRLKQTNEQLEGKK